ncbi:MAG: transketolase C-terminal domain-containing protein, partial [Pseudomonadota bacterium]|nr:transketolase C-terminal domain-containing protein [Pseudomonadota bacterium]
PATVADARFAKPLDTDLVERLVKEHEVVITIEEASIGGFATQVLEYLAKNDLIQDGLKIRPMHLPDRFQDQASPFEMYDDAELNASHIVQTALLALGAEKTAADIKAGAAE